MNYHSYGGNLPPGTTGHPGLTSGFDFGGLIRGIAPIVGEFNKPTEPAKPGQPPQPQGPDIGNILAGVGGIADAIFGRPQPPAPAPGPAPMPAPAPAPMPAPPPFMPTPTLPPPMLPALPPPAPALPPPAPIRQQTRQARQQMSEAQMRAQRVRVRRVVRDLMEGVDKAPTATVRAIQNFLQELQDAGSPALLNSAMGELKAQLAERKRRQETLQLIRAIRAQEAKKTAGSRPISTGVSMGPTAGVTHGGMFTTPSQIVTQNPAQGPGAYVLSSGVTGAPGCPWQYQNYGR